MKAYKRKLIAGWFDLMGIENGLNYIRFNRATCVVSTTACNLGLRNNKS